MARLIGLVGDPSHTAVKRVATMIELCLHARVVPARYPVRATIAQMANTYVPEFVDAVHSNFAKITLPGQPTPLSELVDALEHSLTTLCPGALGNMLEATLVYYRMGSTPVLVTGVETQEQADAVTRLQGELWQVMHPDGEGQISLLPAAGKFITDLGDQKHLQDQVITLFNDV